MACSITITSVIGIPMGGSTTSTVHVSGTVSGECQPVSSPFAATKYDIIVVVDCGGGPVSATTLSSGGSWAVDVPASCACTKDITVIAECASNAACRDTFTGVLQCQQSACPTGSIIITPGDCNPDGTRNVSFAVNITSVPPGNQTFVGQFDYGNGLGAGLVISAPGLYPDPTPPPPPPPPPHKHPYIPSGQPYQVRFIWILPSTCPPITAVLSGLQTCPIVCPTGNVQVTASPPSDCTSNNTRSVTLQASVTGIPPQNPLSQSYEWDFPGGTLSPSSPSLQTTGHGLPPAIIVDYPAATASAPVASCTVRIFDGVCPYMGMTTIAISRCGTGGNNNPNNGGFGFCAVLLVAAIILLLLGGLSIGVGTCASIPPLVTGGEIAEGIGLVLFAIWAFACRRVTPCSVMQKMQCILFLFVAIIGPILLLLAKLFGTHACLLGWLGAAGGWGAVYAWLSVIMGHVGCQRNC